MNRDCFEQGRYRKANGRADSYKKDYMAERSPCQLIDNSRPVSLALLLCDDGPHRLSPLFDPCLFSDFISQVIQLRTADHAPADHLEFCDVRGVKREGSLYADAIADLT